MQEVKTTNAQLHSLDFLERTAITHSQKKENNSFAAYFSFLQISSHTSRHTPSTPQPKPRESTVCTSLQANSTKLNSNPGSNCLPTGFPKPSSQRTAPPTLTSSENKFQRPPLHSNPSEDQTKANHAGAGLLSGECSDNEAIRCKTLTRRNKRNPFWPRPPTATSCFTREHVWVTRGCDSLAAPRAHSLRARYHFVFTCALRYSFAEGALTGTELTHPTWASERVQRSPSPK